MRPRRCCVIFTPSAGHRYMYCAACGQRRRHHLDRCHVCGVTLHPDRIHRSAGVLVCDEHRTWRPDRGGGTGLPAPADGPVAKRIEVPAAAVTQATASPARPAVAPH